jgi:hypothetical protein
MFPPSSLFLTSLKNIFLHPSGKSSLQIRVSRPSEGRFAIVTNVGMGCGGRGSVRRAGIDRRAGLWPVSDHGALTNGAEADGEVVWFWHPLLVLNRRRFAGPTGSGKTFNPPMTVAKGIRRREEHEGNR